jgi:predicted DNA-binding mobile mystery protein A
MMKKRSSKPANSAGSLALQRRQLDARLRKLPSVATPRGGWIRTIRQSLGMTMKQLAMRLRMSPQSVLDLEARETSETISLAKLREAAEALNCELKVVFVPAPSLEETVKRQATIKAREERARLIHTMQLAGQGEGVADVLDERMAVNRWLSERPRRLWD